MIIIMITKKITQTPEETQGRRPGQGPEANISGPILSLPAPSWPHLSLPAGTSPPQLGRRGNDAKRRKETKEIKERREKENERARESEREERRRGREREQEKKEN